MKKVILQKKIVILIADHKKYSKDTIMKYFHCTKYKVDQARKLKSLANGLEIPKKSNNYKKQVKYTVISQIVFLIANFYKMLHTVSQI